MRQNDFKRNQQFFQPLEPDFLILAPLLDAAAAEFPFLESQELQLLRRRDIFLPINVVEPERRALDFAFDEAPENGLDAAPLFWKQTESEFFVEIFGDDLRIVGNFKNHILPVADDRHAVITLLREFPDQRAVLVWDVRDFEGRAGKFEDAPLGNAERTPRNLDQFNHYKKSSPTDACNLRLARERDERKHRFTQNCNRVRFATWLNTTRPNL